MLSRRAPSGSPARNRWCRYALEYDEQVEQEQPESIGSRYARIEDPTRFCLPYAV
jgi:hypothetical protein